MLWRLLLGLFVCFLEIAIQGGVAVLIWRNVPALARWAAVKQKLWRSMLFVQVVLTTFMLIAMVQIALWAAVFMLCGQFADFEEAFYHSAVNFTTLGYGDVVMPAPWRILGPIEALNGILLLGLSSATLFSVTTMLREARHKADL